MQNDLSNGAKTEREARDVGSFSFAANVYPVQVDLTEWTRKFERKFEDFTKVVDLRFKDMNSLVRGLEGKIDLLDSRQNATEKLTSTRFEEVKERIDQFENRLSDSKAETKAQMKELETRIEDQCSCLTEIPGASRPTDITGASRPTDITGASSPTDIPGASSPTDIPGASNNLRPTSKSVMSTVTTPTEDWILIQKHNFKDKNAFKNKRWEDYKHEFGDRVNEFWLGLKKMHDLTKDGKWKLKISITYDRDFPSSLQGKIGVGIWDNFSVASEEDLFKLDIESLIEKENMGSNDLMALSDGAKFSTIDNKNNEPGSRDCAKRYGGGWWFRDCSDLCGNCQISKIEFLYIDGMPEMPSESAMWIKQVLDN